MKDNYLITIDGIQRNDVDEDKLSLTTLGSFYRRDDSFYIIYKETQATGFDGDVTMLKVEANRKVTMQRKGKTNSELTIERGQKHLCHYDTGHGNFVIGVLAKSIDNRLSDIGGHLSLSYSLDINSNAVSENELNITVRETENNA